MNRWIGNKDQSEANHVTDKVKFFLLKKIPFLSLSRVVVTVVVVLLVVTISLFPFLRIPFFGCSLNDSMKDCENGQFLTTGQIQNV
jgi:hypothetical protein